MKANELNQEQLEKVNGGGIYYKISEVVLRDLVNKTVTFKTTTSVSFTAKVIAKAIYRTMFCGKTAYRDVYQLQFTDSVEHAAWGGWYVLGDSRDYFEESNKITDTSTISSIQNY